MKVTPSPWPSATRGEGNEGDTLTLVCRMVAHGAHRVRGELGTSDAVAAEGVAHGG